MKLRQWFNRHLWLCFFIVIAVLVVATGYGTSYPSVLDIPKSDTEGMANASFKV